MKDVKDLDDILMELKIVMVQKHQDYGPTNGLLVRMHDKMERLKNLYYNRRGNTPNYESIEDSYKDLANYAIIGLLVQRGQWEGTGGGKLPN
jgi:hypothetical protein